MRAPRNGVMFAERATEKFGITLRQSTVKTLQHFAARFAIGVRGKGHASVATLIVEAHAQGKFLCNCGSAHTLPECHQEGK
jgi:hypothetical protein